MIWRSVRLGAVASTRVSNVDKHTLEGEPVVRLCNYVDVYKNETIHPNMPFMVATASTQQLKEFALQDGDTIITKDSETADDIGVPAYVSAAAADLVCGYHLAILRPVPTKVHPKYLFWAMKSKETASQWETLASGVTRVGLRSSDLKTVQLPMPESPDLQVAIADFLDRETAKIDALIEKQQSLLAGLMERRAAVLRYLVLGRQDCADPAGPWFGHPPDRWVIDKLGRHVQVVNGSTPSREKLVYWTDGTFPWLNSSFANMDRVTEADQFVTESALRECHLPVLEPGAILVGITGQGRTRGRATLLQMQATISQHLAALVPGPRFWHPRYLTHLIRAAYDELRFISDEAGSTKGALTCADLAAFRLPRPSFVEQSAIANEIDEAMAELDSLAQKVTRAVDLARERRAALISAAVTGQLDIASGKVG